MDLYADRDGNIIMMGGKGSSTEGMACPVRCRFCAHVHDSAGVEVVTRYSDCSVWRCPGCRALIDDRPEGWGGSAYPMPGHPQYRRS